MKYYLLMLLIVGDGQEVEVRVPFATHDACIAKADEITSNVQRYSWLFGAKVNSSGCFKT